MGSPINFSNRIHISDRSWQNGAVSSCDYKELTPETIDEIAANRVIKYIQISKPLPAQAFEVIDKILALRDDIFFRIFGLYDKTRFDLSCLYQMEHLRHLTLDTSLKDKQDMFDLSILTKLGNLRSLHLDLFDLRDYSFIQELSPHLHDLSVHADTMGGAVKFDCDWLRCYKELDTLFLGRKAGKHIESIAHIDSLRNLTLKGIKPKSLEFLRPVGLHSLTISWCAMNDLTSLRNFELKSLCLWRISKLEDISFIPTLLQLETLRLADLKHITHLPDMSELKHLRDISLENVPVDISSLPEYLRKITRTYR